MAEPLPPGDVAGTLKRNIDAVARRRADYAASASRDERLAIAIGRRIGRMGFVYGHIVLYGAWLLANAGAVPGVVRFDPGLVLMGSIASVEAIFLSLLILITQNNASAADDRRDELSLHIGLLSEHELTQLIKLNLAIASRLGVDPAEHPDIADTVHDVAPEAVLDKIEGAQKKS